MTGPSREVAAFEDTEKKFLVRPAHVLVRKGETITWVNCTEKALELHSDLGDSESKPGDDLQLTIDASAKRGAYAYTLKAGAFEFNGESKPEIIVK